MVRWRRGVREKEGSATLRSYCTIGVADTREAVLRSSYARARPNMGRTFTSVSFP